MANDEWYTPEDILNSVDAFVGARAWLDPTSSPASPAHERAGYCLTAEDDALMVDWAAVADALGLFMNPPYSNPDKFIENSISFQARSGAKRGIVLVNAATSTRWGQRLLAAADFVCFVSPRIRFLRPRMSDKQIHEAAGRPPGEGYPGWRKYLKLLDAEHKLEVVYERDDVELVQPGSPRYENMIVGFAGDVGPQGRSDAFFDFQLAFGGHGYTTSLTGREG